ncbi:hypothetical protein [Nocardia sp. NPDC057440]|uniref:hypothetical protein n=1 Tax=Nocardia sp. NPDC057440 TaxID=3346134 RepID=UPI00366CADC6
MTEQRTARRRPRYRWLVLGLVVSALVAAGVVGVRLWLVQEYYQSTGRFTPIAAGYQPRTGDVLLYGPASPFSQHTNIVLTAGDGVVTTMGGNEFGDIRMHRFDLAEVPDIVGFGRL